MCFCENSRKRKASEGNACLTVQSKEVIKTPAKTPRKWKVWEDVRLIVAARRHGISQWKHVANEVGNSRNHMQVLQRWKAVIEPAFSDIKWSEADDSFLRFETNEILKSGKSLTPSTWRQLAARIPFRSGPELQARWYDHIADSDQKLDYTNNTNKNTDETNISMLSHDYASLQVVGQAPHEEITPDLFSPPPQPPPPPPPLVSQLEIIHNDHRKQASAPENDFYLALVDDIDNMNAPLSSADQIFYDDIKHLCDIPHTYQFEALV